MKRRPQITYDQLAGRIFNELTAIHGPLYSAYMLRNLGVADVQDAVIVAYGDDSEVKG